MTPDDKNGLLDWAKRWHLSDRWCVLLAGDTSRWYATHPDARRWEFSGEGIFAGSFPFEIEPLQIGPFYYDPTWRGRRNFKADVMNETAYVLDEYCDRIEAAALAAGLKRVLHKRELEHFDWLARYQVQGESFALIARTASYKMLGGRRTVHKAITELANYLERTLRPST